MKLRTRAVTVIALAMLTVPTGLAAANPLPDPLPRPSPTAVRTDTCTGLETALAELREAYRSAPWPGTRTIHNEILFLSKIGNAAL